MEKKRTHYPRTTAQQRRLLFETWQATGSIAVACGKAHVCQRTFYTWRPRFERDGYAGLEQAGSHTPKAPPRTSAAVEAQVLALHREQPSWGKRRLADELAKRNNWVRVVSLNTVRRILQDAGLWPAAPAGEKKRPRLSARPRRPAKP